MNALNLQLPDSLYKQLAELAKQDGATLNQWITLAIAEKLAALRTVKYLEERAKRGNRADFEAVLAKVPDVEPESYDRLP
ncbi:MAG: toxin-antitoxin system HicB family antitoxin [Gammaproteobacteria bacterium]|nr:toxin-antitoxin system HicB family antitoxin [Gammaproteobacteria bacterium]